MLFLKRTPLHPLSTFVEYLWLLRDTPAHAKERILPTGTLELVVNLHEDEIRIYDDADRCRRFSGTVISGAFSQPFVIDTAEHALVIGAHFRPGGAAPFMRVSPGELAGAHGDAELVARVPGGLRERLCRARTDDERLRILERALLPLAAGAECDLVVAHAVSRFARAGVRVREVLSEAGLSHRHFATTFRDAVGTTPKVFSRIQRFQRSLACVERSATVDWARLASACGYYDQAHLIREFSALAGSTPCEYARRRSAQLKDHHVMTS